MKVGNKVLFGLACLGLGYITHESLNIKEQTDSAYSQRMFDLPKLEPQLEKDTLCLSKCFNTDSLKVAEDSIKLVKKLK